MTGAESGRAVLAFGLGAELYGLDLERVRAVRRDLPGAEAAGLDGVVEGEGGRLPLVDLRRRLGVAPSPGTARLVVVEHPEAGALALRVDRVTGVERVTEEAVMDVPALVQGPSATCVSGIARLEETLLVLLDLGALLTPAECAAARTVHAAAPADHKGAP